MFEIRIYKDRSGRSEIAEWIAALDKKASTSKESRIRLKKVVEYIELLKAYGTQIGVPVVKHITGTELWELRPTSDRIFFFYWKDDTLILLHHFVKKSQKTPQREIQKAKNNLRDYLEREGGSTDV